jgi:hypothetical protein
MTSFMLLTIGSGPKFCVFLFSRLLIVRPALSSMVFCLDFGPFFFLLLFPCRVFFLYLFISNSTIHHGHEEGILLMSNWIH